MGELSQVGEGGGLDGLDGSVVVDGGGGGHVLDVDTDLLREAHRGLLTPGRPKLGRALLKLLLLLNGVGKLETFLILKEYKIYNAVFRYINDTSSLLL